jgi:hypothetical protein
VLGGRASTVLIIANTSVSKLNENLCCWYCGHIYSHTWLACDDQNVSNLCLASRPSLWHGNMRLALLPKLWLAILTSSQHVGNLWSACACACVCRLVSTTHSERRFLESFQTRQILLCRTGHLGAWWHAQTAAQRRVGWSARNLTQRPCRSHVTPSAKLCSCTVCMRGWLVSNRVLM